MPPLSACELRVTRFTQASLITKGGRHISRPLPSRPRLRYPRDTSQNQCSPLLANDSCTGGHVITIPIDLFPSSPQFAISFFLLHLRLPSPSSPGLTRVSGLQFMRHSWQRAHKVETPIHSYSFQTHSTMQAISNNVMFALPDFMASANGRKNDSQRPRPLHLSKSFTRVEPPSPERLTRNQRASTIQNGAMPEKVMANVSRENVRPRAQPDAFENHSEEDEDDTETPIEGPGKLPDDFDELPVELASLSDTSVYLELDFGKS
jgi:hypothetical protein